MDDAAYYLSAVIGRKPGSLEVRTTAFSSANLEALLDEEPAAIAVAPEGALVTERLLEAFSAREELVIHLHGHGVHPLGSHRWHYYAKRPHEQALHLVRSVDSSTLRIQIFKPEVRRHQELLAFVREELSGEMFLTTKFDALIEEAMKPRRVRSPDPSTEQLEAENHAALRKAREQMLERVETYTSAQLAAGCDSVNVNPSQFAADMRKANRIFAVRFGRDWRYPRFQFNHGSRPLEPFPEMREVLTALAPDKRGWDRLQWFLEPNSVLNGRIALEVWSEDRSQVVEAARMEHRDARD
jgi:hypothetical protein